ncbi:sortase domain-containing protein [Thomasclavelia cocleata]|uniref:sortase domain-containing protein n=1 Tax=Thomasclavelia cocleata TaxID=69824 RepID=UPI002494D716|nr:sortase [Thomasclavelia cocleata]
MKSLKLFIFLTTVILVFNINISYGRENKNSNQTTHIITVNKDNLLTVIQDNELEKNKSIDKNSSSTDNDSKHEPKVLKDNTITIPNVCDNAKIMIGSTQHDVNKYDICLMTEAAAFFGQEQPILLGGHNTKSLKYLYKSKIGDIIIINYSGSYYQYKVVYSSECTTDNYNLFDIDNGKNVLEYRTGKEVLQIYTCYGSNNRWFVKAVRI